MILRIGLLLSSRGIKRNSSLKLNRCISKLKLKRSMKILWSNKGQSLISKLKESWSKKKKMKKKLCKEKNSTDLPRQSSSLSSAGLARKKEDKSKHTRIMTVKSEKIWILSLSGTRAEKYWLLTLKTLVSNPAKFRLFLSSEADSLKKLRFIKDTNSQQDMWSWFVFPKPLRWQSKKKMSTLNCWSQDNFIVEFIVSRESHWFLTMRENQQLFWSFIMPTKNTLSRRQDWLKMRIIRNIIFVKKFRSTCLGQVSSGLRSFKLMISWGSWLKKFSDTLKLTLNKGTLPRSGISMKRSPSNWETFIQSLELGLREDWKPGLISLRKNSGSAHLHIKFTLLLSISTNYESSFIQPKIVSSRTWKWNPTIFLLEEWLAPLNLKRQTLTGLADLWEVSTIDSNFQFSTLQNLKTCTLTFLPFKFGTEIW